MIRLKQEHESVKLMWSNFIKDNNEDTSIKTKDMNHGIFVIMRKMQISW